MNRFMSSGDLSSDNDLASAGYNISTGFTHYVVGTDGVLRAFNEGDGKPYKNSREVKRRKCR